MSEFNEHINTFETQDDYNAYIETDKAKDYNLAFVRELASCSMFGLKPVVEITPKYGAVVYTDGTFNNPEEDIDTSKTILGMVVSPNNSYNSTTMAVFRYFDAYSGKMYRSQNQPLALSNLAEGDYSSSKVYGGTEDGYADTQAIVALSTDGCIYKIWNADKLSFMSSDHFYLPSLHEYRAMYNDYERINTLLDGMTSETYELADSMQVHQFFYYPQITVTKNKQYNYAHFWIPKYKSVEHVDPEMGFGMPIGRFNGNWSEMDTPFAGDTECFMGNVTGRYVSLSENRETQLMNAYGGMISVDCNATYIPFAHVNLIHNVN